MTQLIVERYRLDEHVASINNSEFYNGFDLRGQQQVIVRLIHLDQGDEKTLAKLQRDMSNENKLHRMRKLTHPSILRTLDYGRQDTIYYQINEFVNFKTLRDEITQTSHDLQLALRYGRELASIVAQFHAMDIIHCDIKPENAIVTPSGLKLIEFAIANHTVPKGHATGTPAYMSPEAVEGEPVSVARDAWALGVVLYELITGSRPYPTPLGPDGQESQYMLMTNIFYQSVPPIEGVMPNLPPRLVSLIHVILEKDPARRMTHMDDVAAELDSILNEVLL